MCVCVCVCAHLVQRLARRWAGLAAGTGILGKLYRVTLACTSISCAIYSITVLYIVSVLFGFSTNYLPALLQHVAIQLWEHWTGRTEGGEGGRVERQGGREGGR